MTSPSPLKPGVFYHIYNRGTNREDIFVQERNYRYFMQLYAKYIEPVAETYAYCLLKNHFHILVRVKDAQDPKGLPRPLGSIAFSNLFNAYAKAINKACRRTGSLFQRPFGRIPVLTQAYLIQLVRYIHLNPQKHRLVSDFREWPYSSYPAFLSNQPTRLQRDDVRGWFGSAPGFIAAHQLPLDDPVLAPLSRRILTRPIDPKGFQKPLGSQSSIAMDEHDLAALRERIGDEHLKRRLRAQVDKMIWARGMGRGRFHYENLPLFVHAVKLLLRVTGLGRRGERNALALTVRENPVVLPSLPPALDGLRILLAHSPEVIPKASERGFCLYLTGHTHAGQICLPGGWSPMVNARCPRRYIAGAWTFNGMAGYTSRGTGSSGVFARFNCPPEIVIHVLRASG